MIRNIFFITLLIFVCHTNAQDTFRVTYSGRVLSSAMTNRLKSEVSDPAYLKAYSEL